MSRLPLICFVCGDVARGLNFNLITCMSCKAFFRRNAMKTSLSTRCQFENACQIDKKTRSFCSPCRLKKCFSLGMNPELIRVIPSSRHLAKKNVRVQKRVLSTPRTLNLLQNDYSLLTTDQWNLLSNLIHVFDEHNPSTQIQNALRQLALLPPKLRLRPTNIDQLVGHAFTSIASLIDQIPDFYHLSKHARRALSRHNLRCAGSLNGLFICRNLDLYKNEVFINTCNIYYGTDYMRNCACNSQRYDSNGTLIKIFLYILTYSSNCSIVLFDPDEDLKTMASTRELVHVQDTYVTILWKYLIYLYGYEHAATRFASLVKSVLDVSHLLESMPTNQRHEELVNAIIADTERTLIVENPL